MSSTFLLLRRVLPWTIAAATVGGLSCWIQNYRRRKQATKPFDVDLSSALSWRPPLRSDLIKQLSNSNSKNETEEFDLLIIGGGATGAGCALDAASRGLKVALVDGDDFAGSTSSKSTKLIHGGVRYLEKAFWSLDRAQFALVVEALTERAMFLQIAPHLTDQLSILLPVHSWIKAPYYWMGAKCYDLLAGIHGLHSSYWMSRWQALKAFPTLQADQLKGGIVYYDGTMNDARMNLSLILTAIFHGAVCVNHMKVTGFIFDNTTDSNRITGAELLDQISGEKLTIKTKGIINATGPHCDKILNLSTLPSDNAAGSSEIPTLASKNSNSSASMKKPTASKYEIIKPSTGTHVILPKYCTPDNLGMIDASSSDGRVVFLLPWEGASIAGTTDTPVDFTDASIEPTASDTDVNFLLQETRPYINQQMVDLDRKYVQAAWAGLRPLVQTSNIQKAMDDKQNGDTASLVRSHLILDTRNGMITITGGKWTTYRRMAEETVDAAIRSFNLQCERSCQTGYNSKVVVPVIGAHGFDAANQFRLMQLYDMDQDVARNLHRNYGDRAEVIAALALDMKQQRPDIFKNYHSTCTHSGSVRHVRLHPRYSYLLAEVVYAVRYEYAMTAADVLSRRLRLAQIDVTAASDVLSTVIEIMAGELKWTASERKQQMQAAKEHLISCGLNLVDGSTKRLEREKLINRALVEFGKQSPNWSPIHVDDAFLLARQILGDSSGIDVVSEKAQIGVSEFIQMVSKSIK